MPVTEGLEVVIVTGLSGAGRSTAAKCLEDLGYFVVDNLPPELIATMVDLGSRSEGAVTRIAVVMDVRSRAFSTDLRQVIVELDRGESRPRVLFLEASDDVLVRRFESVRREHPLAVRIVDGLAAERKLLAGLRGEADVVIDTSRLNVHELRNKIEAAFGLEPGSDRHPPLRATVLSFGYKYGLPMDADLVVVDGGPPQVAAAYRALTELGIEDVGLVGLAKRLEEVWLPGDPDPVIMSRTSDGLYLLQRIRDEAHRFAITYHRAKRSRAMTTSALDAVPGLGGTRKKALLTHFGSLKRLRAAAVEDIMAVPGIGRRTAEAVAVALSDRAAEPVPAVDPLTGEILEAGDDGE